MSYINIKNNFNKAANSYDDNAVLQQEIGRRLIERLDFFTIKPDTILDLGMGTGYVTNLLSNKYPESQVIGLDLAEEMLTIAKNKNLKDNKHCTMLCGDINNLPIESNCVDLIFSNFSMQWCTNFNKLIKEFHRILKTDGLLFFSMPGPDTLYELRTAINKADPEYKHINDFIDMHDIGDILMQTKFAHPVMDNEYFTLTYSSVKNIMKDLKSVGANTKLSDDNRKSLFSKAKYNQLITEYDKLKLEDNKYPLSYEIVYGHAFKPKKPVKAKHPEISETMVPIEKIIKKQ